MIDHTALQAEIQNDPQGRGYAGKTDVEIANLLNDKVFTRKIPITITKVLRWGAKSGALAKLHDNSTTHASQAIRAICLAALKMLDSPTNSPLDMEDAEIIQMIGALVAAGVFVAQDQTDLNALATVPCGRSEVLFKKTVHHLDVAKALRG